MLAGFRSKIIVLVLAVAALALAGTTLAVLRTTAGAPERLAAAELGIAQRVFWSLLESERHQLHTLAQVLSSDAAFERALAGRNKEAMLAALAAHNGAISPDLVLILNRGMELVLSNREFAGLPHSLAGPMTIDGSGGVNATAVLENKPYNLVLRPLVSRQSPGWMVLGVPLQSRLLHRLRDITGAEVTLLFSANDGVSQQTTFRQAHMPAVESGGGIAATSSAVLQQLSAQNWLSEAVMLDSVGAGQIHAILSVSRGDELPGYQPLQLQLQIVFIAALALLLAALTAIAVARRVQLPVSRLMQAAARITNGNYSQGIQPEADAQFRKLGDALNSLQQAVAERESRIEYQALHDVVTQLPNRNYIRSRFESRVKEVVAPGDFALCLLQVSSLSQLADLYGTGFSDTALKAVAERITVNLRRGDLAARVADNQILLFYEGLDRGGVERVVKKLQQQFREPLSVQGVALRVELILGFVLCPEHGTEFDDVLRRSQIALAHAKFSNTPFEIYQIGQDKNHLRQIQVASRLQIAVEQRAFTLLYQPKYHLERQEVTQVEALLRWSDEELGEVLPDEFIPLAEQMGMISRISDLVLDLVIEQQLRWRLAGINLAVCINLSGVDVLHEIFVRSAIDRLRRSGLPESALVMEITETAMVTDMERALANLALFEEAGIEMAIDDFGTGYSSLSQLKALPVKELKIDKSLVQELHCSHDDKLIVRSTIEMAHSMGLKVVAEGVENQMSATLLHAMGCDAIQGFFLAKPMPAEDLKNWLAAPPLHVFRLREALDEAI